MGRKKKSQPQSTTILGFASWAEAEEWARKFREQELRAEMQHAEWCWPLEEDEYPLDGLLTGACLRVLRALWSEAPLSWPVSPLGSSSRRCPPGTRTASSATS